MKPVDEQATRLGFWATLFIGIFAWALNAGQFDDLEREGERILGSDDAPAFPLSENIDSDQACK